MLSKYPLPVAIAVCVLMMGCPGDGDAYRELTDADDVPNTTPAHVHDHDEGPNGGHILEFGTHHGEIAMGQDRVVSVFILGDDTKTAHPVEEASMMLHVVVGEETVDIPLKASPLEGEADGQSSRFVSTADALPESIKDIEGITGSVDLVLGDKTSTAKVTHDHDDHSGHDH